MLVFLNISTDQVKTHREYIHNGKVKRHCGKLSQQISVGSLAHWNSLFVGFLTETVPNENTHWNFLSVGYPNELETMNFKLKCNANFYVDIHWNSQCVVLWISGWNTMSISTWIFTEFSVHKTIKFYGNAMSFPACACASMKFSAQGTEIWVHNTIT